MVLNLILKAFPKLLWFINGLNVISICLRLGSVETDCEMKSGMQRFTREKLCEIPIKVWKVGWQREKLSAQQF